MNYNQLAIAGIALLALATSGCSGGTTTTGYNPASGNAASVVTKFEKKADGTYVVDQSFIGCSETAGKDTMSRQLDYSQRRLDAEHGHKETMYTTAAENVYKGQKLDAKSASTEKEKGQKAESAADMQRQLFEEAKK